MKKGQKKEVYEPYLKTIQKYLAAANEIQSLIIKNNGKITWVEYIAIVTRHSITTTFLSNWTQAGFIKKVSKGVYRVICHNIEPFHIRQILNLRNEQNRKYQAKLKKRLILKQNIAKFKNKDKTDVSKFPYEDKWTDSFNMPDSANKISDQDEFPFTSNLPRPPSHPDYQKKPTYNYVKPEKHEKKQKSFSLFWGLINIKF
jgi:hypothetical protein